MSELVRIVNTRPTLLTLPDIRVGNKSFSKTLLPGGNNIPMEYLEALEDLPTEGVGSGPGRVWQSWQDLRWVEVDTDPEAVKRAEGPEPPKTLAGLRLDQAEALVDAENDAGVLRMWLQGERREPVERILRGRLAALGVSPEPPAPPAPPAPEETTEDATDAS